MKNYTVYTRIKNAFSRYLFRSHISRNVYAVFSVGRRLMYPLVHSQRPCACDLGIVSFLLFSKLCTDTDYLFCSQFSFMRLKWNYRAWSSAGNFKIKYIYFLKFFMSLSDFPKSQDRMFCPTSHLVHYNFHFLLFAIRDTSRKWALYFEQNSLFCLDLYQVNEDIILYHL